MNQGGPANCRAFLLQVSYKTPFISFWHGAMPNRHRAKPGREPWPLFPSSLSPVSDPLGLGPWTLGRVPGGQVPGPGRVPGGHVARYLVARSLDPGPRYLVRVFVFVYQARPCLWPGSQTAQRGPCYLVRGPWSLVPGPWWPGRGHGPCSAGRGPVAIRYRTRRAGQGPRTGGRKNGPMPGVRAPWPGFTQSVTGKSVSGPYLEIWVSRETSLWKTPPFD